MKRPLDYADRIERLAEVNGLSALVVKEWFEERAAIREYDGGLSRAEAEKAALADIEAQLS